MPPFQIAFTQMCGQNKSASQDTLCAGSIQECHCAKNRKTRLAAYSAFPIRLAVADGVFNSPQPELASQFWAKKWAQQGECTARFFQAAFAQFCDDDRIPFGSSTTFVGLTLDETGQYSVCNLGDSRAYHISANGKWTQISHDHSLINSMIARGEAQAGVDYSQIYQTLEYGLIKDEMESEVCEHIFYQHNRVLQTGEAMLLCSDGLHDALSHEQLERIWQSETNLLTRLFALKKAVKQTPFYDDCSIVCVQAA